MKIHDPIRMSDEIWKEIHFLFWRKIECLPDGASGDGIDPHEVVTTKRGIEITGKIWFLPGGWSSQLPEYSLELCLSRPQFSSIEGVTAEKIRNAKIREATLVGDVLSIVVK